VPDQSYTANQPNPLLFVTQVAAYDSGPAGAHGVLEQAASAMQQIAEGAGLGYERVHDVRDLEPGAICAAGALGLFTIGETPWRADQRGEILAALRAGTLAVVAIHSATDASYRWPEYGDVVGARFDGHPWTQDIELEITAAHPATTHLPNPWPWHDEVYQFRDLRPDAQVLLRVAPSQLDLTANGAKQPEFGFPLSWCFSEGKGRVFSTSLGHFPHAWEHPPYLQHVAGGLRWARGLDA
jgi:type 1 glutamine amidotransferase